jgi:hypothetical protein
MGRYTELLYARPSIVEGIARTLDVGGNFDSYNESRTPKEADHAAIASDWHAVGCDLRKAIHREAAKRLHEAKHVAHPAR